MINFKGSHYRKDVILYAVFFCVRYAASYRDLEKIMAERGVYRGRLPKIDMTATQVKLAKGLSLTKIAREMWFSCGTVYKAKALM